MRQTDMLWNGYRIIQDDQFFKLGQDSMLLSAFAVPPHRARVLDLGCGNGALGILLHMRNIHKNLRITGLELQPEVAELARENLRMNGMEQTAEIITGDLKRHKQLYPTGAFDYIICNPPYFSENSGYRTRAKHKQTARQEFSCSLEDVVQAAAYFVKFGGRAAFVYRPERVCELISVLQSRDLQPKRLRFVHQHAASAPSAVLLEARRGSAPGVQVLPPLLVCGEDGTHTAEYRAIYHEEDFA